MGEGRREGGDGAVLHGAIHPWWYFVYALVYPSSPVAYFQRRNPPALIRALSRSRYIAARKILGALEQAPPSSNRNNDLNF